MEEIKKYNGNEVCCFECGIKHLTEKQKQRGGVHTAHNGICCVCGKEGIVLPIRHYNYLDSSTLKQ